MRVPGQVILGQVVRTLSQDIYKLSCASRPWRVVALGSPEERMRRVQDKKMRQACKEQFDSPIGYTSLVNPSQEEEKHIGDNILDLPTTDSLRNT